MSVLWLLIDGPCPVQLREGMKCVMIRYTPAAPQHIPAALLVSVAFRFLFPRRRSMEAQRSYRVLFAVDPVRSTCVWAL